MRQLKIATQITLRDAVIEKYFSEIEKFPQLTAEQEVQLAKRIKLGDEDAYELLVNCNLRFAVSVAKQYQNQGLWLSDLINESNIGLCTAARKFDETRGFKFISYAVWWCRQSILQAISEKGRMVRIPQNKVATYSKANKLINELEQEIQREPTAEEIAQLLDVSENVIVECVMSNSRHASLDAPMINFEESGTMGEVLEGDYNSEDVASMSDLKIALERRMKILPQKERDILIASFGLGGDSVTVDSVGLKYDLTKERVRQLREKAIGKLQRQSNISELKAYL